MQMVRVLLALVLWTALASAAPLPLFPLSPDALATVKKRAEAGSRSDQTNLAEEFTRRLKYSEAEQWYKRAARQGDPRALCGLGEMYHQDRGFGTNAVKMNLTNAIALHRLAAAQGYQKSHFHLGFAYKTGQVIPKDKVAAYRHFKLSGSGLGDQYLKDIILEMKQAEIDRAEKLARDFKPVPFERAFEEAVFESVHVGGTIRNNVEKLAIVNGELVTEGQGINVFVGGLSAQVKFVEFRTNAVVAAFGSTRRVLQNPATRQP
jgi:hypothetical protein